MIAEVIIQSNVKNLNKTFDYEIPYELEDKVNIGSRVFVPLGNMKKLENGFVVGIKPFSEYKVREIASLQGENILDNEKIELAKWMARRYFCNISDCLKLMLPPGTANKDIEKRAKEKNVNFITLKKDIEDIKFAIESKKIKSEKQIRALEFIMNNGDSLVLDLEVQADVSRAIINTLCKNGYLEIIQKQVERDPFKNKNIEKSVNLKFTDEQQNAYDTICDAMDDMLFSEFLIDGVTGCGKTEIYIQLIDKVLNEGKTSIVLVPEISLTPQTVNRFISRFGKENIAVLHSKLGVGERYDQWYKIKNGEAKIIIGARSAIFAPLENLGIIIIDEEHDSSYKAEGVPRYDAKEVARKIAKENNIPLVLGSATPDFTSYFRAKNEKITVLKLTKRANEASLPDVEVVDLREELANRK